MLKYECKGICFTQKGMPELECYKTPRCIRKDNSLIYCNIKLTYKKRRLSPPFPNTQIKLHFFESILSQLLSERNNGTKPHAI
jgi:hypothetical protein